MKRKYCAQNKISWETGKYISWENWKDFMRKLKKKTWEIREDFLKNLRKFNEKIEKKNVK